MDLNQFVVAQFIGTPESATERYERLADEFQRETGMTAPGKDVPAAMGGADDYAARFDAWRAWLARRQG